MFGDVERVEHDGKLDYPSNLTAVGSNVLFAATRDDVGRELFALDASGTHAVLVKDIAPGTGWSEPQWLTRIGDELYFVADDGEHGRELWKSDGTPEGTVLVADLIEGAGHGFPRIYDGPHFTSLPGAVTFVAPGETSTSVLWRTDGTSSGTVVLARDRPTELLAVGGTLYFGVFVALDPEAADAGVGHGLDALWKTDGTPEGTELVKDFSVPELDAGIWQLATAAGTLLVTTARWFPYPVEPYLERSPGALWRSDGTEAGTVLVREFPTDLTSLTTVGPDVYFAVGWDVWRSDGSAAGTTQLSTPTGGPRLKSPHAFTNVNGTLFFLADHGMHGRELWTSDGTRPGTRMVKVIRRGGPWGAITPVGSDRRCVFAADDGRRGTQLWTSDGTTQGTRPLSRFESGLGGGPDFLLVSDRRLYFRGIDWENGGNGRELWSLPLPGIGSPETHVDADSDGFPDEAETAIGADPVDPQVNPHGPGSAYESGPLGVTKLSIDLRFDEQMGDRLLLRGRVRLGPSFRAPGTPVTLDVGGVVRTFTLDEAGRAGDREADLIRFDAGDLRRAARRSVPVRFRASVSRADLRAALTDEGLTDGKFESVPCGVATYLFVGASRFADESPLRYTASPGLRGKARL